MEILYFLNGFRGVGVGMSKREMTGPSRQWRISLLLMFCRSTLMFLVKLWNNNSCCVGYKT